MKELKLTNVAVLITICCSLLFVSCGLPPVETTPAKPTPLVSLVPILEPLPETKLKQTKGGVEITVFPVQYSTTIKQNQTANQIDPPLFALIPRGATRYYEVDTKPVITTTPDQLVFRVTINNLLPRVFRGAGAIVHFMLDGKALTSSAENYAELSQLIIPPRQAAEFQVYGVKLSDLPDAPQSKATLGIFLYDVVTKVDQAGNIVEKQNFEWYFNFSMDRKEVDGPPIQIEHIWR